MRNRVPFVRVLLAAFAILHLLSVFTLAQLPTATINGRIADPKGLSIAGAKIEVINVDTGVVYPGQTGEAGFYSIGDLPPGTYRVTVQKEGFARIVKPGIQLHVQDMVGLDFSMQIGSVLQTITVQGGAPLLETESGTLGAVVDRQLVQNLPLNGRSFQALIEMTPGVTITPTSYSAQGQFSVNGMRADMNSFTIDGVSVNGGVGAGYAINEQGTGSLPNGSILGGFNNLISVDDMQEFKIETSNFAPEYGREPGAQIVISTRSGTNQFHGDAFDYFRNDKLDANDWFSDRDGLPKAVERQNDFGFVVGGPLIKDKLFFFASYEGLRLRQPVTSSAGELVPSMAARNGTIAGENSAMIPLIDAFPLPTGPAGSGAAEGDPNTAPFAASFSNPTDFDAGSLRVDWNRGRSTIFGRYNQSPSETSQRTASDVRTTTTATKAITTGWTFLAKRSLANDLRFNYSSTSTTDSQTLDTFGGAVPFQDSAIWQPQWNRQNAFEYLYLQNCGTLELGKNVWNSSKQFNIVDTLSWVRGNHTFKFGVDYRQQRPYVGPRTYDQFLQWYPDTENFITGVMGFSWIDSNVAMETLFQSTSLFAQDAWKAGKRLTLTYGVRYEVDPAPTSPNGTPMLALTNWNLLDLSEISTYPLGHSIYPTTWKNFAPRVGAAYRVSGNPRWGEVLRGGIGIFYDTGGSGLAFNYGPYGTSTYVTGDTFPLTAAQAALPPLTSGPPYQFIETVVPNYKLPYALQMNLTFQQQLGQDQAFSMSYVGSLGKRLPRDEDVYGAAISPNIYVFDNSAYSNYSSLQALFQRRFSHGLEAMVNWVYSHALDVGSSIFSGYTAGAPLRTNYGNSDFDVRHTFNGVVSYNVPTPGQNPFVKAVLGSWGVDGIYRFRTGLPQDIEANFIYVGITDMEQRPNIVPGQPFYINDPSAPGGWIWNVNAFSVPSGTSQGDLGRNYMRGYHMQQGDISLRRDFPLKLTEYTKLQFRSDFFNIFNHPNFSNPWYYMNYEISQFGQAQTMLNSFLGNGGVNGGYNAMYQVGGPRSIQLSLKFFF